MILAWTAWEALKTSRATSEANNLKLLPLLGIYFYPNRSGNELFRVKNIGEGVAYNIEIDLWTLIFQDSHDIMEFKMEISGTNILAKNEEKDIQTKVYVNGKESPMDHDLKLAFLRGFDKSEIQLQFKDATGKKCACLISISKKKVNILKPAYRLNLFSKIDIWYDLAIQRSIKIGIEKFLWRYEKKTVSSVPNYPDRILHIIGNRLKSIFQSHP